MRSDWGLCGTVEIGDGSLRVVMNGALYSVRGGAVEWSIGPAEITALFPDGDWEAADDPQAEGISTSAPLHIGAGRVCFLVDAGPVLVNGDGSVAAFGTLESPVFREGAPNFGPNGEIWLTTDFEGLFLWSPPYDRDPIPAYSNLAFEMPPPTITPDGGWALVDHAPDLGVSRIGPSGHILWTRDDIRAAHSPLFTHGGIVVNQGGAAGQPAAFSPTGATLWTASFSAWYAAHPDGWFAAVGQASLARLTHDGNVIWSVALPEGTQYARWRPMAFADGIIVISSETHCLAFDADGTELWRRTGLDLHANIIPLTTGGLVMVDGDRLVVLAG